MESFTLLKFWRRSPSPSSHPHHVTTLLASAIDHVDDGPFFDLEFDISDDDDGVALHPDDNADGVVDDCGLNFVLSPPSVHDPSDDDDSGVFLKGELSPVLPSPDDAASPKPAQFSAKLRVLISGLKKSGGNEKPDKGRRAGTKRQNSRKLFIKFKVEEKPFASLFARDNSSKPTPGDGDVTPPEERGLSREAKMQRYLKKVKPLYVGVSKLRSSSQLKAATSETPSGDTDSGRGNEGEQSVGMKVGFGVMCRQLGKSRSASAAVTAVPSPCATGAGSRKDDSLLQQQDGIQGAILHCKRSFNDPRDSDAGRSATEKPSEGVV